MDGGFRCLNGLKRCITYYKAPARTTHTLFFTTFECHAETMQITPNERLRRQSNDADR
jgi:hypothetical protein